MLGQRDPCGAFASLNGDGELPAVKIAKKIRPFSRGRALYVLTSGGGEPRPPQPPTLVRAPARSCDEDLPCVAESREECFDRQRRAPLALRIRPHAHPETNMRNASWMGLHDSLARRFLQEFSCKLLQRKQHMRRPTMSPQQAAIRTPARLRSRLGAWPAQALRTTQKPTRNHDDNNKKSKLERPRCRRYFAPPGRMW